MCVRACVRVRACVSALGILLPSWCVFFETGHPVSGSRSALVRDCGREVGGGMLVRTGELASK